jgi:hypothetical protein
MTGSAGLFHATQRRLSGSVVLATPLSVRCLGLVCRNRARRRHFRVDDHLRLQGDGPDGSFPIRA